METRKYNSTDEIAMGDVVMAQFQVFGACVVEAVNDKTVRLARPHAAVIEATQSAVLHVERWDVPKAMLIDAYEVAVRGPSGEKDNRRLAPI